MKKTLSSLAFAAALPLLTSSPVLAATVTYTNGSGDLTLDNPSNWDSFTAPTTTDEAVFIDGNPPLVNPIGALTLVTSSTYGDLVLNSTALTGIAAPNSSTSATLTLSGGGGSSAAILAGGATGDLLVLGSTVTGTVNLGGATAPGTGKLSIALGANGNIDVVNSAATLNIAGPLSGAFSLVKTGAGTLQLSSTNTTGDLIIKNGTVVTTTTPNLGTGTVRLGDSSGSNNATLIVGISSTYTNNIVVNAGSTGTLTIEEGPDTATGQNPIMSGNITLNNNVTLGELREGSRSITFTGTITGSNTITINSNNNSTLPGVILTGNNASTFTGNIVINGPTAGTAISMLGFGSGSLGTAGTISFGTNGRTGLTWNGVNTEDVSGRFQALTGTAAVTLDIGSNNVTFATGLAGGAATSYTKKTNSLGILTLSVANSLAGTYFADTVGGTTLLTNANALQNATVSLIGNTSGTTTGGITFDSSVASHAFTFGNLTGAAKAVLPNLVLQDNAGNAVSLTIGGSSNPGAYAGILSGTGSILKTGTGTLTLSGANSFTGGITINGGVVSVSTIGAGGANGSLGAASNAAANLVLGGGDLRYTGATASTDRNFTLTSGTISTIESTSILTLTGGGTGAGGLNKAGTGTVVLAGVNSFTGATMVTGGTLTLNGAGTDASTSSYLVNQATLAVDNSGVITANRLAAVGMTLQGGTYTQTGQAAPSSSTSETVGTLTLDSGANTITLTQLTGAGTSTTFTASNLVRNNRSELFVRGSTALGTLAPGSSTSEFLTLTSNPSASEIGGGGAFGTKTISILPYMVGTSSATGAPSTFVTYDTTNNSLRVLNTSTEYDTLASLVPTANVRNSSSSATVAVNAGTFNSMILDENSASAAVTDTLGGTVTLTSGAMLFSKTAGTARAATLTGGVLQAASGTELIITNAIGTTLTLNSQISGSGGLTLNSYVNGTSSSIILGSTANNYTGATTLNGIVKLGTSNVIPDASTVSIGAGGIFDLNGNNESINALSGMGTVDTTLATNASTLTVGASNGSGTFNGVIQNTGVTGATLAVAKTGTGAETFTGNNTYSGGTAISNGAFYANSTTGSSTGSGAVSVTSGGTLSGLGHIAPLGSNGIGISGGILAPGGVQTSVPPGGTPGTVANGSLTIDTTNITPGTTALSLTNATLTFALGAGGANSGSQIVIGGANTSIVNFNNSTNVVTINDLIGSGLSNGTEYTLIDGASNTTFNGLTFGATVVGKGQLIVGGLSLLAAGTPGNDFANLFGTSQLFFNNGDIFVDVEGAAVPEPGTWALMIGGFALLIIIQRRKAGRV